MIKHKNWLYGIALAASVGTSCSTKQPSQIPPPPPMTYDQQKALAYIAVGATSTGRDNTRAIDELNKALALDPDNRDALGALAFGLMADNRIDEAVPIWRNLASVDDTLGLEAGKWLKRAETAKLEGKAGEAATQSLARTIRAINNNRNRMEAR